MKDEVITVPQAGRALGLSRSAAYRAAQRGDIPTIRIRHRIVVPKEAFTALLEGRPFPGDRRVA